MPGEVFIVPPEEGSHDTKDRPHVVVSEPTAGSPVVTLAYGSTSPLEAVHFYAPHVKVDKSSPLFRATGLDETTYFYPSRLVACMPEALDAPIGKIIDELTELRDVQLRRAVGIGLGSNRDSHPWSRHRRGLLVKLRPGFAEGIQTNYGVIVTYPPYSKRDRVHNIVPIYDADTFDVLPPHTVLGSGDWAARLHGIRRPALVAPLVQGVYVEDDVESSVSLAVDGRTMASLDDALSHHLWAMPAASLP